MHTHAENKTDEISTKESLETQGFKLSTQCTYLQGGEECHDVHGGGLRQQRVLAHTKLMRQSNQNHIV